MCKCLVNTDVLDLYEVLKSSDIVSYLNERIISCMLVLLCGDKSF